MALHIRLFSVYGSTSLILSSHRMLRKRGAPSLLTTLDVDNSSQRGSSASRLRGVSCYLTNSVALFTEFTRTTMANDSVGLVGKLKEVDRRIGIVQSQCAIPGRGSGQGKGLVHKILGALSFEDMKALILSDL